MAKIYNTDLAAFIEDFIYRVRLGLRKTRDDQVAIVEMPKTIRFSGEAIIRKDDLARSRVTSRGAATNTSTAGTSVDVDVKSAASTVATEAESMTYTRTGGETGGESGTESGGQSGSGTQGGTEGEIYGYVAGS